MNWKKITFIFIIFLTFLGNGSLLSNVQSREADQLLEAHGLSNNTRYFFTKNKQKISTFLHYLKKNHPKDNLQLHFDNKKVKNQVLVWANHKLLHLPTQTGRYFSQDDFSGNVSLAVLGLDAVKKSVEFQQNRYIIFQKRYYSVIGILKDYHKNEQKKYYLSTGINQPTATDRLSNYRISIDSSNHNSLVKIASHYHAKLKIPEFVKKHQVHRFSVLREILVILVLFLIAVICNSCIAIIEWNHAKFTNLKGILLRNWGINRSLRLILLETLLGFVAYIFLRWQTFLSKPGHLVLLLFLNWLVAIVSYLLMWIVLCIRNRKNA